MFRAIATSVSASRAGIRFLHRRPQSSEDFIALQKLFQSGRTGEVLQKYQAFKRESNFTPTNDLARALLSGFVMLKDYKGLNNMFETLKQDGLRPNRFAYSWMIRGACDANDIGKLNLLATELKRVCGGLDGVCYGNLIRGYLKAGATQQADAAFDEAMVTLPVEGQRDVVRLQMVSWLIEEKRLVDAQKRLEEVKDKTTLSYYNTLLTLYARQGNIAGATSVLRDMVAQDIHPTELTYSLLVDACTASNDIDRAVAVFEPVNRDSMMRARSRLHCYDNIIAACCRLSKVELAEKWWESLLASRLSYYPPTLYRMYRLYDRVQQQEKCEKLFELAVKRGEGFVAPILQYRLHTAEGALASDQCLGDLRKYNIKLREKDLREAARKHYHQSTHACAEELHQEARKRGLIGSTLDEWMSSSAVSVEQCLASLDATAKQNRVPTMHQYFGLMCAYCTAGDLVSALSVYHQLPSLGFTSSYLSLHTLICAVARSGEMNNVEPLFKDFLAQGFKPSKEMSVTITLGYIRERNVEGIRSLIRTLEELKMPVDVEVYRPFLAMLLTSEEFTPAVQLLTRMDQEGVLLGLKSVLAIRCLKVVPPEMKRGNSLLFNKLSQIAQRDTQPDASTVSRTSYPRPISSVA